MGRERFGILRFGFVVFVLGYFFPTVVISPISLLGCFLLGRQTVDTISVD